MLPSQITYIPYSHTTHYLGCLHNKGEEEDKKPNTQIRGGRVHSCEL